MPSIARRVFSSSKENPDSQPLKIAGAALGCNQATPSHVEKSSCRDLAGVTQARTMPNTPFMADAILAERIRVDRDFSCQRNLVVGGRPHSCLNFPSVS